MDLSKQYDVLVEAIIRPPRVEYSIEDLGSADIRLGQRYFHREDFELLNPRGLKLQCSLFAPVLRPKKLPCVIYCHGNSGCRLDAIEALKTLLPMNVMVAALDFAGCGLSEGEYISLGFYEKTDVNTLVNHLRDRGIVSRIALWGRSMGAVTAIQCAQADPSLACIVADSAFSNLQTLAVELASNADFNIPGLMLKIAFSLVRKSVKKKAKFDIKKLDIIKYAQEAFVPALFGHGDEDEFIAPSHTVALQAAYAGDSNKVIFGGDHNSTRPPFFMSSVSIFFRNHLFVSSDFGEDNPLPNKMTMEEYFSVLGGGDAMRIFVPVRQRTFQAATDDSSDVSDEYIQASSRGHQTDVTEDELIQQAIALSLQEAGSAKPPPNQNGSPIPPRRANARPVQEEEVDEELAAVLALSAQEAKAAGIEVPDDFKSTDSSKGGLKNSRDKAKSDKHEHKKSGSSSDEYGAPSTASTGDAKKDSKKEAKDKKKKEKEKKRKSTSFSPKSDTVLALDLPSSPSSDDPIALSSRSDTSPKKKEKKSKDKSSKDSKSSSSKSPSPGPPYPLTKANTIHTIDSRPVDLDASADNDSDEAQYLISSPSSKKKSKK